jgi:hypothetical protein
VAVRSRIVFSDRLLALDPFDLLVDVVPVEAGLIPQKAGIPSAVAVVSRERGQVFMAEEPRASPPRLAPRPPVAMGAVCGQRGDNVVLGSREPQARAERLDIPTGDDAVVAVEHAGLAPDVDAARVGRLRSGQEVKRFSGSGPARSPAAHEHLQQVGLEPTRVDRAALVRVGFGGVGHADACSCSRSFATWSYFATQPVLPVPDSFT